MPARLRVGAGVVIAWLLLAPVSAAANNVSGSGQLTVSPSHGLAPAAFTATFSEPAAAGQICPPFTVTFSWDSPGNQLGQVPLGGPDGNGNCTAALTAKPPAADSAPGGHLVIGDDGNGNAGDAPYTIDRAPAPGPSPTRRPSPSPSPSPPPSAKPKPSPSPSPSAKPKPVPSQSVSGSPLPSPAPACTTFPPINPVPGSSLASFDGLDGGVQADPFEGWATATGLGPAALVPPGLGHAGSPQAELTRRLDALSPALPAGRRFDCVRVSLGPATDYFYARYVFQRVLIVSVQARGGSQTLALLYQAVAYDYLPRLEGGVPGLEVTGEATYRPAASAKPSGLPGWPAFVFGAVVVAALGGAYGSRALGRR